MDLKVWREMVTHYLTDDQRKISQNLPRFVSTANLAIERKILSAKSRILNLAA